MKFIGIGLAILVSAVVLISHELGSYVDDIYDPYVNDK